MVVVAAACSPDNLVLSGVVLGFGADVFVRFNDLYVVVLTYFGCCFNRLISLGQCCLLHLFAGHLLQV